MENETIDDYIRQAEQLSKRFGAIRRAHLALKLFDLVAKFAIAFVLFCAAQEVTYLGTLIWFCFGYQATTVAIEFHGWFKEKRMTKKLIKDTQLLAALLKSQKENEE